MYRFVKRLFDILLSFFGFVILLPLLFAVTIAIKIDSRGPAVFKQKRYGIHKTYFNIYKFRTMRIDTPHDSPTHLLINPNEYITRVGRFLRITSIDELPQIINILIGQMSIIGPRPALWNQDDLILERDKYKANDVKPGLTGWAQVNGRDKLSIEDKAKFDGEYIKRMSLLFDLKCLFFTVIRVIKHEGVMDDIVTEKDLIKNQGDNTDL